MSSEIHGAVAERYSQALFELAEEKGVLDAAAADLQTLLALLAESRDLRRLVASPVISRADQEKAVLALAAKAGFGALVANFLGLLARNRRLFVAGAIARAFLARLARRRGEIKAEITSAVPLSAEQTEAIASALKTYVGGNVGLDAHVDPSLLGGLVVKVGSRMVDNSLRTKLQHLKIAMKGIG